MKRKNKIFLSIFLLVVIALFIVFAANYQVLRPIVEEKIVSYGYSAIFVFSLLADVLEQPFGPEIPASLGVIFGLNIFYVFIFCVAGSFIGSFISFYFGRSILHDKVQQSCVLKKHRNYCRLFQKYGKLTLFLAAVSPIPYVFFCWLSGAFYMKVSTFFFYGLIPRALRIGVVLLIVSAFL